MTPSQIQTIREALEYCAAPITISRVKDRYRFCRKALDILNSANDGWQDIASAPKDGTVILVYNGAQGGFYTAPYEFGTAYWNRQAFSDGEYTWCSNSCCDGVTTYNPTHYQLLPAPPQSDKE